jgi:hypothetical protein
MPVNNTTDFAHAVTNCSICTVAGILGSDFATVWQDVSARIGEPEASADRVSLLFVRFLANRTGTSPDPARTAAQQVAGLRRYLTERGLEVAQHGAPDGSLRLDDAVEIMAGYPDGTRFACLIYGREDPNRLSDAHWVMGEKADGRLLFTDYQTDTANDAALRAEIRTRRPVRVDLAAPARADRPMRPFGQPCDPAADCIVVLAVS